ncbi:MAG: VOC family protein [Rhodocyclaceae bacterium]|nr:VOC family protein [Rhodocyclaceae bacterium]
MQAGKAKFSFTKIIVDDLDRPATFYKAAFGMREMARIQDALTPERPIEEIILTLANDMTSEPPLVLFKFLGEPAPKASDVILGFMVPDVDATVERVRSAGGRVVRAPKDQPEHGVRVAFATDCDGRLLEIVQMLTVPAGH